MRTLQTNPSLPLGGKTKMPLGGNQRTLIFIFSYMPWQLLISIAG